MIDLTIGIELINDKTWMGGTIYLSNLAHCIYRLPPQERPRLRLLGNPDVVRVLQQAITSPSRSVMQGNPSSSLKALHKLPFKERTLNFLYRLSGRLKGDVDVLYPGFGLTIPGATIIRWIPDFQHRYLPELFSVDELQARDESMASVASQKGVVILSSQVALRDFQRFFPEANATPRVWPFHSLIQLPPQADADMSCLPGELPEKFIYLPNQFWVHKNHSLVFSALHLLRQEYGLTVPLVCTGAPTDTRAKNHFDYLLNLLHQYQLQDQVRLLGLLPRDQQLIIFRRCAAVVQPSLFEGWSTVVEDTRAIGRPIFLSDLPVHREQMPDNPFFFDPHSSEDFAQLIATHWDHLSPGPNAEAEAAAQATSHAMIQASARQFVSYCLEARQLSC